MKRSLPITGRWYSSCDTQAQRRATYSTVKIATEKVSNQRSSVSKRVSIDLTVPKITAAMLSRMSARMKISNASKPLPRTSSGLPTSTISQILFFRFIKRLVGGEWMDHERISRDRDEAKQTRILPSVLFYFCFFETPLLSDASG